MKSLKIMTACVLASAFAAPAMAEIGPKPDIAPTPTAPFIAKVCSPYVPNGWRAITIVPMSWTPSECQAYARSVGATMVWMGCMFDNPPPGLTQRYSWGQGVGASAALAPRFIPTANCGWRI